MQNEFSVAAHWPGTFNESALQKWAEDLRSRLAAPKIAFGMVFMTPEYFEVAPQALELLRVHAQIPLLVGCSSTGLIMGAEEMEKQPGLVLALFAIPAELKAIRFGQEQLDEFDSPDGWHGHTGILPHQTNGWLVFADPFHLNAEQWMQQWNGAYPGLPVMGGLSSGKFDELRTQVYLNGDVLEEGGVAISFGGDVSLAGVVCQGCAPIGETWTITKADGNFIHEIGNRPAYEVLVETLGALPSAEQKTIRGNLFVGLVINEYLHEFHQGDFLIRNLLGADPQSGAIAVAAFPRAGQTLQFQRRDARAAREDLQTLLARARDQLGGATIYGACLCCCNGRGRGLFGDPSHDAGAVQKFLGPLNLAGFFCNGELGPVGDRSFLHCYTASLALFLKK
jgi:small ligand-binding sensory domain FIST